MKHLTPEREAEIIALVVSGDNPEVYQELVEAYQSRLCSAILGIIRDRESARDVTQDAFIKAYTNLQAFNQGCRFYTWIYRIAVNLAIDLVRVNRGRRAEPIDDIVAVPEVLTSRLTADEQLKRQELGRMIIQAIDLLPEAQRAVIKLREIDGLSYKEIADSLSIPEGTVMSSLFYARKKLQEILTPYLRAGRHPVPITKAITPNNITVQESETEVEVEVEVPPDPVKEKETTMTGVKVRNYTPARARVMEAAELILLYLQTRLEYCFRDVLPPTLAKLAVNLGYSEANYPDSILYDLDRLGTMVALEVKVGRARVRQIKSARPPIKGEYRALQYDLNEIGDKMGRWMSGQQLTAEIYQMEQRLDASYHLTQEEKEAIKQRRGLPIENKLKSGTAKLTEALAKRQQVKTEEIAVPVVNELVGTKLMDWLQDITPEQQQRLGRLRDSLPETFTVTLAVMALWQMLPEIEQGLRERVSRLEAELAELHLKQTEITQLLSNLSLNND